jgi:hypothetical protein
MTTRRAEMLGRIIRTAFAYQEPWLQRGLPAGRRTIVNCRWCVDVDVSPDL